MLNAKRTPGCLDHYTRAFPKYESRWRNLRSRGWTLNVLAHSSTSAKSEGGSGWPPQENFEKWRVIWCILKWYWGCYLSSDFMIKYFQLNLNELWKFIKIQPKTFWKRYISFRGGCWLTSMNICRVLILIHIHWSPFLCTLNDLFSKKMS